MIIHQGDVDIDFANRDVALLALQHVPASMLRDGQLVKHNTGIYFHNVPIDPITKLCSIHYAAAKDHQFFKIDLLNVYVYSMVRDEQHLCDLMDRDINWQLFEYTEFTEQLIHIGRHSELVRDLKPQNVNELAMVLALIRPGQRHLIDRCKLRGFASIEQEIWNQGSDGDGYVFRKSHSIAYAHLVVVHANLLVEQLQEPAKLDEQMENHNG